MFNCSAQTKVHLFILFTSSIIIIIFQFDSFILFIFISVEMAWFVSSLYTTAQHTHTHNTFYTMLLCTVRRMGFVHWPFSGSSMRIFDLLVPFVRARSLDRVRLCVCVWFSHPISSTAVMHVMHGMNISIKCNKKVQLLYANQQQIWSNMQCSHCAHMAKVNLYYRSSSSRCLRCAVSTMNDSKDTSNVRLEFNK